MRSEVRVDALGNLVLRGDLAGFEGEPSQSEGEAILVGPPSGKNLAALRTLYPWLQPKPLGLSCSAGFGDRLGLATPGHIKALRHVAGNIAPVFAQQSIRENARTHRTPKDVLNAAVWAAFRADWREGFGADADHVKLEADVDDCVRAGYSLFTFDPGDFVHRPCSWSELEDTRSNAVRRYTRRRIADVEIMPEAVDRALAKYGKVVVRASELYRHLRSVATSPVEVEISVDETEDPTSPAEHVFLVTELRRLGVEFISLAPRFEGRFEKGVDYIGSVARFARSFAQHADIARELGPYKLSLHSGSDKFAIYEMAARLSGRMVHLKTAGTSYLEALRVVAHIDPNLFGEIFQLALERFPIERATYHVSADVDRARLTPGSDALDQFDTRQILHVTFGSVLDRYGDQILELLRRHAAAYTATIEKHFIRHLTPFAMSTA